MANKPTHKPKPADPEEYMRFRETAKAVEAEDDPDALKRAVMKLARPKHRGKTPA